MTDHGCWTSEYDWEVSLACQPKSRETVLCVLFDDGAQRRFSSVRITMLSRSDVTPRHDKAWVGIFPLLYTVPFRLVDHL